MHSDDRAYAHTLKMMQMMLTWTLMVIYMQILVETGAVAQNSGSPVGIQLIDGDHLWAYIGSVNGPFLVCTLAHNHTI